MPSTYRQCDQCGFVYAAQRSTSRFCSDACRKRHGRAAERAAEVTLLPGPVTAATRRELVAAGRLESAMGQLSLLLATHIDSTTTATVRALAPMCKAHRETLLAALKDSRPVADVDPIDVLRRRRRAKLNDRP